MQTQQTNQTKEILVRTMNLALYVDGNEHIQIVELDDGESVAVVFGTLSLHGELPVIRRLLTNIIKELADTNVC
jgi:hypothetical protein